MSVVDYDRRGSIGVLRMGFPDFWGEVLKYAHDPGLAAVQARIEKLAERLGERCSPCELLRN